MATSRRSDDRRRRVFYNSIQADHSPSTAASRREKLRLRQARKPGEAYGSAVRRRLRGRWFSIVPVRRRSAVAVCVVLLGLAGCLTAAHYLAVRMPVLVEHPELARPLRIDRTDSFGAWVTAMLFAGAAGVTLLIYQLRRYRIDDYRGQYRVWRLVLAVTLLASVNSLTATVDWSGAILDIVFGKRIALSGTGWLRLVLTFGGVVFAVRLMMEVRQSPSAVAMMFLTWGILAIPTAIGWRILEVKSLWMWTLQTSAPLLSSVTLFLALGLYLRLLYREVRKIQDEPMLPAALMQLPRRVFSTAGASQVTQRRLGSDSTFATKNEGKSSSEVDRTTRARSPEKPNRRASAAAPTTTVDAVPSNAEPEQKNSITGAEGESSKATWWSRLRRKRRPDLIAPDRDGELREHEPRAGGARDDDAPQAPSEPPPGATDQNETPEESSGDESGVAADRGSKRGWFGRRRRAKDDRTGAQEPPIASPSDAAEAGSKDGTRRDPEPASEATSEGQARRGLKGWFGRRKKSDGTADGTGHEDVRAGDDDRPTATPRHAASADTTDAAGQTDSDSHDGLDESEIDWDGLSKSERRRMRKQLKRQGRAA